MIDEDQLPSYTAALLRILSDDREISGVLVCVVCKNGDVLISAASELGADGTRAIALAAENQVPAWGKTLLAGSVDPGKLN